MCDVLSGWQQLQSVFFIKHAVLLLPARGFRAAWHAVEGTLPMVQGRQNAFRNRCFGSTRVVVQNLRLVASHLPKLCHSPAEARAVDIVHQHIMRMQELPARRLKA
jgi:hypothetical protein